jgi:hypothetical protein
VIRHGKVWWLTHPPRGAALITVGSRALSATVSLPEAEPVASEAAQGELLAITHAMFMASTLAERLVADGSPANELVVEANCLFSGPPATRELIELHVDVRGRVPGITSATFREAAITAQEKYLRSSGMRSDIPFRLTAAIV